ncbi:VRR-NUC domain-containing protein [Marinobacterium sp. xm-d-530]|uniref:VRR-NUC domain-containing protein n=1 Tax=Marinobacterium sp. xm-d-530 TaxID=2497747 RepID=UPI001568B457|nr:VRR-NUC domain-containing protein [Marinobacterium sp. xm-d-530]NRQ02734.1 VRR-NUC domain protein [Marinobacterium sp. xm-d-530]
MTHSITSAELTNPLYYLQNAQTLIDWVVKVYQDLLTEEELDRLSQFQSLSEPAKALLIRMVMRSQSQFLMRHIDHYQEIIEPTEALIDSLVSAKLIALNQPLSVQECFKLLNRQELLMLHNQLSSKPLSKSSSKQTLYDSLQRSSTAPLPLHQHLPLLGDTLHLLCDPLFERLKLMFFGNLHQSWSEFVVTELGYFKYEPVELSLESRAFHRREDLDQYIELEHLLTGDSLLSIEERVLATQRIEPISSWLAGRKDRVLYLLARELEREDQTEALRVYQQLSIQDAHIRELRLLERLGKLEECHERTRLLQQENPTPLTQLAYQRLLKRSSKKLGVEYSASTLLAPPQQRLTLDQIEGVSVERQVAEHLTSENSHSHYVENHLINGLFGLLFWDVIYAPVPGAFFNPFQSRPADLYRSNFKERRYPLITEAMIQIETGQYRETIRQRFREKQGITNSFIHWSVLTEELVERALNFIPADHLKRIFERLLMDIRTHRSGLPDLIRFNSDDESYELIEVKGPGDRIQDNQKLWLDFFVRHDIPCSVYWIEWSHPE